MTAENGSSVGIAHPTVVPANIDRDPRWRNRRRGAGEARPATVPCR